MSINKDFPCICGHKKSDHNVQSCSILKNPNKRFPDFDDYVDDCMEYIPDNIKYLELIYEKNK